MSNGAVDEPRPTKDLDGDGAHGGEVKERMQNHATALTKPELEDLRHAVRRCERQWQTRTTPVNLIDGPLDGMRTVVDRSLRDGVPTLVGRSGPVNGKYSSL